MFLQELTFSYSSAAKPQIFVSFRNMVIYRTCIKHSMRRPIHYLNALGPRPCKYRCKPENCCVAVENPRRSSSRPKVLMPRLVPRSYSPRSYSPSSGSSSPSSAVLEPNIEVQARDRPALTRPTKRWRRGVLTKFYKRMRITSKSSESNVVLYKRRRINAKSSRMSIALVRNAVL